jgi:archaellum biogenesis ATPase FlaH
MTKLGRLAQKYAQQGFQVFPLASGSKVPMKGTRGLHDATTDLKVIADWWSQHPDSNIGIRTGQESGITVVDYDVKSGGMDTLKQWGDECQTPAELSPFSVQTAGGGIHAYYNYDPELKQTAGLAPGVDCRSDGGYVVGPGSIIGGKTYESLGGEFLPVPEFIKEKQRQRARRATEAPVGAEGAGVGEGGRNAYLTKVAGALRRQGLTQEQLESVLISVNDEQCEPPLDPKEVHTIAWSNARYEPAPDEVPSSTVVKVQDMVSEMNAYLKDKDRVTGEPTGIAGLDEMLGGGLRLGEITALHAEAKTGKNTVMHRIILELLRRGLPVGYASRELSPAEEVLPNLLSIEMGKNLLKGMTDVPEAAEMVKDWPLYFAYGYGHFPLEELQLWVKNLAENYGVRHFFLDHLHYMLMNEDYQQAAVLIKTLKSLAKKLKVQMFIIIQPTKVLDGAELGLNTLKGGSAIGQTIDNLLTLRRVKECEDVTELALTHARGRNCKPGRICLKYDRETMDLEEGKVEPLEESPAPSTVRYQNGSSVHFGNGSGDKLRGMYPLPDPIE